MLVGGASSSEAPMSSIVHSNRYAKIQPFFHASFMAITFNDTTIKHLMYMHKVPFQYTERACVFGFEIHPKKIM